MTTHPFPLPPNQVTQQTLVLYLERDATGFRTLASRRARVLLHPFG